MRIFFVDKKLAEDTFVLGDLEMSRVLVMDNANFPWLVVVPKVYNVSEVFELTSKQREKILDEVVHVSKILKKTFDAEKINIATFGNKVRQLHFHIIARFEDDIAWPEPVWGFGSKKYHPEVKNMMIKKLQPVLKG